MRLATQSPIRKHWPSCYLAAISTIIYGELNSVITDHQPLTSIFKRKTKSPRMNRWILEMREYNYNIQFIKGKHNYVAYHLSRPVQKISRTEAMWLGLDKEAFQIKQREEPVWAELASYLEGGVMLENFCGIYLMREKLIKII